MLDARGLVLALVLACMPWHSQQCSVVHVVAAGDTLYSIVSVHPEIFDCSSCAQTSQCSTCPTANMISTKVQEIIVYNRLPSTLTLYQGERLCLTGPGIETDDCINHGICLATPTTTPSPTAAAANTTAINTTASALSQLRATMQCQVHRAIQTSGSCRTASGDCTSFEQYSVDVLVDTSFANSNRRAAFLTAIFFQTQLFGTTLNTTTFQAGALMLPISMQLRACEHLSELRAEVQTRLLQHSMCSGTAAPCSCDAGVLSQVVSEPKFALMTASWYFVEGSAWVTPVCSKLLIDADAGVGGMSATSSHGEGLYRVMVCVRSDAQQVQTQWTNIQNQYSAVMWSLQNDCTPTPSPSPGAFVSSHITASATPSPDHAVTEQKSDSSSTYTGPVIWGAMGAGAVAIVGLTIVLISKTRGRRRQSSDSDDEEPPPSRSKVAAPQHVPQTAASELLPMYVSPHHQQFSLGNPQSFAMHPAAFAPQLYPGPPSALHHSLPYAPHPHPPPPLPYPQHVAYAHQPLPPHMHNSWQNPPNQSWSQQYPPQW